MDEKLHWKGRDRAGISRFIAGSFSCGGTGEAPSLSYVPRPQAPRAKAATVLACVALAVTGLFVVCALDLESYLSASPFVYNPDFSDVGAAFRARVNHWDVINHQVYGHQLELAGESSRIGGDLLGKIEQSNRVLVDRARGISTVDPDIACNNLFFFGLGIAIRRQIHAMWREAIPYNSARRLAVVASGDDIGTIDGSILKTRAHPSTLRINRSPSSDLSGIGSRFGYRNVFLKLRKHQSVDEYIYESQPGDGYRSPSRDNFWPAAFAASVLAYLFLVAGLGASVYLNNGRLGWWLLCGGGGMYVLCWTVAVWLMFLAKQ